MTADPMRPVPMRVIEEKLREERPTIYTTELAWDGPHVLKAQQSYSFTIHFKALVPSIGVLLFGPQWAVWAAFSQFTPFWYLRDSDDYDWPAIWPA